MFVTGHILTMKEGNVPDRLHIDHLGRKLSLNGLILIAEVENCS